MNNQATAVLDASALLALMRDELGADRVAVALKSHALIGAVNWAEVLSRLVQSGGDPTEVAARALPYKDVGLLDLVPFDDEQARETARLRRLTLGLSLADRSALALARLRRLPILTADRTWRSLRLSIRIEVIR